MTKTEEGLGQRKALGRGLGALLQPRVTTTHGGGPDAGQVQKIRLDLIDPNPHQPRRVFERERLEELAQSIRSDGVIQPIVVRQNGSRYTLIVGERRWRATRLAGLEEIPAIVQDIPPERLLEVTLIENIQREDLNPIETAQAFERMSTELGLSHEEIAKRTGKDRSSITNLLRLLKLPGEIQQLLAERRLSMGHAKAILGLPDEYQQQAVAEKAAAQGLSVRQVERMVQRLTADRQAGESKAGVYQVDPNVAAAVEKMEEALGTRVRLIEKGTDKGRIEIEYYSADDLERIYQVIVGGRTE